MTKPLLIALFILVWISAAVPERAAAQGVSGDITETLSRLKNNPRYRGRVLGTHIRRDGSRYLYEVRILRRDDRVILVYIDPETGGVVGDSEKSEMRPSRQRRGKAEKRRYRNERRNERRNNR
jgi:hypothetical protein